MEHEKSYIHRNILIWSAIGFFALLAITTAIVHGINGESFFKSLTVSIIVSWLITLIAYYAWALYFYNINYGWSEDDWTRFRKEKGVNPAITEEEPVDNPHKEETLGLPPGTVRGTVALTLLIGGTAMTIAALSFGDRLKDNELLIDNFDFFKKAFLMMIAFYFGTKSLEILQKEKKETASETKHEPTPMNHLPQNGAASDAKKILQQNNTPVQNEFYDVHAKG
ncbi:MAG TPA: hypothetical protein VEB86_17025 [Chryseosolibacter sp.]|nr:hypothetical protein [Chryseosolibacter sp.]